MFGMVQSLNLSVSVAVILYEALRQREAGGYRDKARLPAGELETAQEASWLNLAGPEQGEVKKRGHAPHRRCLSPRKKRPEQVSQILRCPPRRLSFFEALPELRHALGLPFLELAR